MLAVDDESWRGSVYDDPSEAGPRWVDEDGGMAADETGGMASAAGDCCRDDEPIIGDERSTRSRDLGGGGGDAVGRGRRRGSEKRILRDDGERSVRPMVMVVAAEERPWTG